MTSSCDQSPEKSLTSAEEFEIYRSLVQNSPDLFYRTNMEGQITYISPSVFMLSGYTQEEAVGMNMAREVYLIPEERDQFLAELKAKGQVSDFEAQLKRKDGTVWWASTNAGFFRDKEGAIQGVQGITRDITRLKDAHQALEESEERFRMAFHTSPDSVNLNRVSDGMYIDINQGFTDLTGYTREDVLGKTSLDINIWADSKDREKLVQELTQTGFVKNFEADFLLKSGETKPGLMSARILRINDEDVILSVTRDISELKHAQELIVQTEKMMSVGGLAAGMAHEINNPLSGLMQTTDLLLRRLTDTDLAANWKAAREAGTDMEAVTRFMEKRDILKMAVTLKDASTRMADIVENMLSFARKSDARISSQSIPDLLDKSLKLAATDFDLKKHYDFKNIKIKKEYEKNLPLVPCEASKLQQVFLNIINNAAHALQGSSTTDPTLWLNAWTEEKRRQVCVQIADNGPGMDSNTQKRIFEPFFTTKPVGVGTGLGLSVSYFIITDNHKGKIEVSSAPGKGARFTICLPF